MNQHLNPH